MRLMQQRERLPNRRSSLTFSFESNGLAYTATASWFPDGLLAELFLNNHKSNSSADVKRGTAQCGSLALQNGTDLETIRRAFSRDSQGHASGPLGAALDRLAEETK